MIVYNYNLFTSENMFSLEIKGDVRRVIDTIVVKYNCSIYDLKKRYDRLHHNSGYVPTDPLYPLAVRYISPTRDMYVIERPPFLLNEIDFSTSKSYHQRRIPKVLNNRSIWMPWTVAVITLNKTGGYIFNLYFNDTPMTSFEDVLIPAYLPNVGNSGQVCMGSDLSVPAQILDQTSSVTEMYKSLLNLYFGGWNTDIWNMAQYLQYFEKNGILKRVQSLKSSPKDMSNILLYGCSSTARYFKNFLYFLSNISLQEHLDYISYCKENHSKNTKPTYSVSNIISRSLPDGLCFNENTGALSRRYEETVTRQSLSYTELSYSDHFGSDQYHTSYTISINDLPIGSTTWSNEELYQIVTNPKLIAYVYNTVQEDYKTNGQLTNKSLSFPYADFYSDQELSLRQ